MRQSRTEKSGEAIKKCWKDSMIHSSSWNESGGLTSSRSVRSCWRVRTPTSGPASWGWVAWRGYGGSPGASLSSDAPDCHCPDDRFFLPDSRALLPTFRTNCADGVSFCPDGVTFCPDFHPQLLFFTPFFTPLSRICTYITSPPPHLKTPLFKKPPPAQPRTAPPRPAPARAGSRPPASCSALKNALWVVRIHLQSASARSAAQMLLCASGSVNAMAWMLQREVGGEMLRPKIAAACEAAASELRHQCCGVRETAPMLRRESGVNAVACMLRHKNGSVHAEAWIRSINMASWERCCSVQAAAWMRRQKWGGVRAAAQMRRRECGRVSAVWARQLKCGCVNAAA